MYAIHFLLFVTTLILCHIIQSCLKPSVKHGETDQPPDEPQAEEASTKEDEEDCLWSPWSAWSECTVTCGDGISVRHRVTLILGNCTSDMVQEKICTEQHCPHGKDFIFQRKDEDVDQSSGNDEGEQIPDDVQQNNHQYAQTLSDAGAAENPDEVPVSPGGRVTGYKTTPNEDVNPENGAHFDENNEQDDDAPRGRGRGQSWTSDDGSPWGHQSSFDSLSHGEDAAGEGEEEGFRSGAEEKMEDADNCFSDCSPTDPPSDSFGSTKRSETDDGAQDKQQKSGQGEGREGAKTGEGDGDGKGGGKSSEDRRKSKSDERLKDDGRISNDEDSRHDVDMDAENDDGNFDDDEVDDADDDDDNGGSGAGKKQKREHEEEDAEQDDLEQDDDEEEEEEVGKKRRRKKKRKRKRKPKTRENGAKSGDSQVVRDPTEIGDTFLANIGNADSVDGLGLVVSENEKCDSAGASKGLAASENEKCDYVGKGLAASENEKCDYGIKGLAASEHQKCDSAGKLTSETEDCSADKSKLEVLEIGNHDSAKKSTTDVSESEICDAADRL